jgi:cytochrome c oxidase assembly factor CtaG
MRANEMTRMVRAASFFALGLLAVAAVPSAHAQSCILCYTSVAGGGPVVVHALQLGILTLLVPALLLFGGVFYLIYRRAMAANEEDSQQPVARPVVRRIAKPAVRPAVSTVAMPIRGTFPTTAS